MLLQDAHACALQFSPSKASGVPGQGCPPPLHPNLPSPCPAVPDSGSAFESKLCLLASTAVTGSPRPGGVQGWDAWQSRMLDGEGPSGLDPERAGLGEER